MAISENSEIRSNLLQCPLNNNDELFFTLMDYLNNLFMSKDSGDILRFYDYFENRDQLIKWMKERPKGNYRIVEFNKDENDIIVVIPTMDVNGKFAKTCRDEIFKGLHIIFVESGIGNYYFNYAHNCNAGIKKAMEYNPKWIILSNDDMYKIDDIDALKNELFHLDNTSVQIVFVSSTNYHSYPAMLSTARLGRFILFLILGKLRRYQLMLEKKYNVYYFLSIKKPLYKIFFKKGTNIQAIGNFGIFSKTFIENINGNLFDEIYINGGEDIDLAVRIYMKKVNFSIINYRIHDYLGSSLGKNTPEGLSNLKGTPRRLRDVANMAYFNFKIYKNNL
jgi:hypothetical protein